MPAWRDLGGEGRDRDPLVARDRRGAELHWAAPGHREPGAEHDGGRLDNPAQHHTPRASARASASRSPGAAASAGGDGTSPPSSVAGWRLTYSTDFPGNSLPSGWDAYNGEPGGDADGNWDPSNVSVSGGALHLTATPSAQGGLQFYGNPQVAWVAEYAMNG